MSIAPTNRGRILWVDDEPALLAVMMRMLQRKGFQVDGCADGHEALRRVAEGNYEVLVTDVSMPGMSGIELLGKVRAQGSDLPVILVSGAMSAEGAIDAINYGVLLYLTKPVDHDKLFTNLERAVQLSRLAEAKRQALEALGQVAGAGNGQASLEAGLASALDGMWIAFQPIIDARSHDLYGYEVLLRSREPRLPHPGAVLDAAERLGCIHRVGRRVRELTFAALPRCEEGHSIFLNLHPEDLTDDTLYARLADHPDQAKRLVLELTERAALEHITDVRGRIATLRSLGCRIAVDDLGAGYAGLSSFVQLEPDIVKLDMSLVRDADGSPLKQRLIGSLTEVCNEMGYLVVAEGIETAAERDTLVDLKCDLLQGYRFGRPEADCLPPRW